MSWRLGLSTGVCTDCPIVDVVPSIAHSGVAGIEIGTPPRHFDPRQEPQIVALGQLLESAGVEAVSIHAPFGGGLDLAAFDPQSRQAGINAIGAAACALKRLGGRLVVVHPSDLPRHGQDAHARLHDAAQSLCEVAANCRRDRMTLVIESPLPHLIGGHPREFAWILEQLDDSVRVCLDTGHTTLGHHWHRFLDAAGPRLLHVHANDNHGHHDDHLPPGAGIIDWREIARSLKEAHFEGWMMLELACPAGDRAAYFKSAIERAEELFDP